ncbi:MAG: HAD family hydrolase [Candidatus Micrarchaeia archaeon]
MFKAVLFDMDGVISDTEPVHESADEKVLNEYGVNVDERWKGIKGLRQIDVFTKAIEMYGIKETPEVLVKKKMRYYKEEIHRITVFNSVLEVIAKLKGKYMLGLVSSSPKECVDAVVNKYHLGKFFDVIITGDDVKEGKPSPEPYLNAAKRLGCAASECIVVEDSINGVKSAKAAGMKCVGITNSFPRQDLLMAGADEVIDYIDDLPKLLESI